jgi:CRISPR-associated endonuclease/helicase Cas3
MSQRFGRVNRFGDRDDTRIDVVYPKSFDEKDDLEARLLKTLELLRLANGDGSPATLGELHHKAMREGSGTGPMSTDRAQALRTYILATYAPQPKVLPVSDILFDSWALTTIRNRLPGRPAVEPYLHGVSAWQPPETQVAWREEVWELRPRITNEEDREQREEAERKQLARFAEELLEDYPLKPHELLRDRSDRVFKHLATISARRPDAYVWLVDEEGHVEIFTLLELADQDRKEQIEGRTVLLSGEVGGLRDGLLDGAATETDGLDVADRWYADDARSVHRRRRVWGDDELFDEKTEGMRLIRRIDVPTAEGDEDAEARPWYWFTRPDSADDDASKTAREPITWDHHTSDVVCNATRIADALLKDHPDLHGALVTAAKFHDLGKKRVVWQKSIGNPKPTDWYAKSGRDWKTREITDYRHEFGSLLDLEAEDDFNKLEPDERELVLHLIAVHHGRGRPHFPADEVLDPDRSEEAARQVAAEVPRRFARLQRKYGRWGLAYLESLLRAADAEASAKPSPRPKEVTSA